MPHDSLPCALVRMASTGGPLKRWNRCEIVFHEYSVNWTSYRLCRYVLKQPVLKPLDDADVRCHEAQADAEQAQHRDDQQSSGMGLVWLKAQISDLQASQCHGPAAESVEPGHPSHGHLRR